MQDYDARTVAVPQGVVNKLSGAASTATSAFPTKSACRRHGTWLRAIYLIAAESQKQYWQVKSKYRDTIIFFKVGKFYELYEVYLLLGQE